MIHLYLILCINLLQEVVESVDSLHGWWGLVVGCQWHILLCSVKITAHSRHSRRCCKSYRGYWHFIGQDFANTISLWNEISRQLLVYTFWRSNLLINVFFFHNWSSQRPAKQPSDHRLFIKKKVQKALSFIFINILNSKALLVPCSGLDSGFTVGTVALFWVWKQVLVYEKITYV